MPALTLLTGAVLTVTGVIAYIVTDFSSWTALIPAIVGVLLVVAGVLARNENLRKHAIHGALAIALLGMLGSLRNVIQLGDVFAGDHDAPAAPITSAIMFVVLLAYLIAGIRSFVAARRQRAEGEQGVPNGQ